MRSVINRSITTKLQLGIQNIARAICVTFTYTNAVVESITTAEEWSLNAVVKKHPNVSAANTVSVNANMVLALAKKVFILLISDQKI